jgi:peptidoglycan/xylan/chitin deacetylase (PgdA/CDA1 family)
MDEVRELLVARGIGHCVAFVVGAAAQDHRAPLQRWLQAGYELGNHTYDHEGAQQLSADRVMASIERCHRLLEQLGAFDGARPRWFRFPMLDRGRDRDHRAEIQRRCEALGYRIAHASVDFFDHRFEQAYLDAGAGRQADAIAARYRRVARESLRLTSWAMQRAHGRDAISVPYFHFGAVSLHAVPDILDDAARAGAEWCSLQEAMDQRPYAAFDRDWDASGLVLFPLQRSLPFRVGRRLARLSEAAGVAQQRRYGPRFPYV